MSVGDVEQVFDPTTLIKTKLVTNGLLDDHIVCLLRRQNLIDVLRRSHPVHLIRLQGGTETFEKRCVKLPPGRLLDLLESIFLLTHIFSPLQQVDV